MGGAECGAEALFDAARSAPRRVGFEGAPRRAAPSRAVCVRGVRGGVRRGLAIASGLVGCAARWPPVQPRRARRSSQSAGTRFKVVAPVVERLWRCDRWVVSRTGTKSLDSARLAAKASHQAGWRACLLAGGHQSFGGGVARALPCRRATRPAAGGCGGADPAAHAAGSAMGRPSSLCLTGRQLGVERALLEACLDAVAAPVPILGFHCTFLGGRFGRVCGLLAMASVRDRKPERFHRRRN